MGLCGLGLGLFVLMAFASCTDETTGPDSEPPVVLAPTSLVVTPTVATLNALGDTVRFVAEVLDQNGQTWTGSTVVWTSSDSLAVSVSEDGLVTGVGNGSATVVASVLSGAVSGSAAVTVRQVAASVTIGPDSIQLLTGQADGLTARAEDANGNEVRIGGDRRSLVLVGGRWMRRWRSFRPRTRRRAG